MLKYWQKQRNIYEISNFHIKMKRKTKNIPDLSLPKVSFKK